MIKVEDYIELTKSRAKSSYLKHKYYAGYQDLDDVTSEAMMVLIKCAKSFKGEEKDFHLYLSKAIKGDLNKLYFNCNERSSKAQKEDTIELEDFHLIRDSFEEEMVRYLDLQDKLNTLSDVEFALIQLLLDGRTQAECVSILNARFDKNLNQSQISKMIKRVRALIDSMKDED